MDFKAKAAKMAKAIECMVSRHPGYDLSDTDRILREKDEKHVSSLWKSLSYHPLACEKDFFTGSSAAQHNHERRKICLRNK